jgi:hypothetical protein
VHHRTIEINHQPDATVFSVHYPDVCFQLNMFRTFSRPSPGAQWLQWQPLVLQTYRGDIRAVFVVGPPVGPARPRPIALLPPRSYGKPETAAAVYKLLMMGMRMPETCWAVFKRRAINLRDWYIWLIDLFEHFVQYLFRKLCLLWGNVEKCATTKEATGGNKIGRMRCACYIIKDTDTIKNTCCFYTTTVVTRTMLNITLYVHCLSCLLLRKTKS